MSADNNWKSVKLSKLGVFSKGAGITKAELVDIGVPAIRYGELYTLHHIKVKKPNSFASPEAAKHSRYITKGDIIFAGSGETIDEIGKSVVYLGDEDCLAGGDTIILSPKGVHPLFLSYYLNSPLARRELRRLGQGQSVVHIYKRDLENLEVEIPEVDEQQRITTILETWDEYLEKLDKKIELKKNIKKGLMQQLCTGEKRLPGFNDKWAKSSFNECLKVEVKPKGLKSTSYEKYGIPIFDQSDSKYISGYTSLEGYSYDYSESEPVILFGDHSRVFKLIKVKSAFGNDGIKLLSAKNGFDTVFLYYLLKNYHIPNTGYNRHFKYIKDGYFEIPDLEEQKAIARVLNCTDKELERLELKRAYILEQKKFLLNTLISGRIRTPENLIMPAKEVQYA